MHKFGSPEEGARALELDARERLLLTELARSIDSATRAIEWVSDEMQILASNLDETAQPWKPEQLEDVDGSREELEPGGEVPLPLIRD